MANILYLARRVERSTPGIPGDIYTRVKKKRIDICKSIELPYRANKRSISSIPVGEYEIKRRTDGRYFGIYANRWSHRCVFEVADVKGRDGILFHAGRGAVDSRGCIITTEKHNIKNGKLNAGGTSRSAYLALYESIMEYDLRKLIIFDVREAK